VGESPPPPPAAGLGSAPSLSARRRVNAAPTARCPACSFCPTTEIYAKCRKHRNLCAESWQFVGHDYASVCSFYRINSLPSQCMLPKHPTTGVLQLFFPRRFLA